MLASWIDLAPSWARWIAQDADGAWWAYEDEPNQSHSGWYENEVGRSIRLGCSLPNTAWQSALVRLSTFEFGKR